MRAKSLVCVFSVPALLCALWTVFAGKDLSWDLLNYHYYLPYEFLGQRLDQDFYAASAQSYLNPIGYIPFFLMVWAGWHSVIASIALAVAHSANLTLLFLISWKLFAHLPERSRAIFAVLATALGAATAVFWATVGTSFLDPLLSVPMLVALLLILEPRADFALRAGMAGLLFGAAAALKYSNAIYAVAALPLVLTPSQHGWRQGARALLAYAAGGILAVGLLAGPWMAMLARELGNPVFPLLNGWFHSPYAPALNSMSARFTPGGAANALLLPLRMALLDRGLYSEIFAPDLRFAALAAAALALLLPPGRDPARALGVSDWRLFAFFAASLIVWVATSANARYGMPVLLLAGVCLARVVEVRLRAPSARVLLGVLLAVQLAMCVMAAPSRWFIAAPWSRHWLPFDVPEQAKHEPALYVTVELLPMAAVAPFLDPRASFVNLRGQHSVPSDSPKLVALLARYRDHVRLLARSRDLAAHDATLERIGYRADPADCFTIGWRPDENDPLSRLANGFAGERPPHEPLSLVSCALRPQARDPQRAAQEASVSSIFDRIERSCPLLFRGQSAVTEPLGGGWSRFYAELDARMEAFGDRVVLRRRRELSGVDLGRLSQWAGGEAALPAACRALDAGR